MQILANALPGFRDLRAPLIAGYAWLLFAWLWTSPELNQMTEGIGGSLYDLSQRAGPIWTGLAVGVAAYLVGALSQTVSGLAQRAVLAVPPFEYRLEILNLQTNREIQAAYERGKQMIQVAGRAGQLEAGSTRKLGSQLAERYEEANREGQRELDLPATLLVGDQAGLFAEVDRVRAEGELRMAVLPPLVALGILLGSCESGWWYLLIPAGLVLFYQGVQRDFDAKKIISDAISMRRVEASSVAKFSEWITETLRGEIERLQPPAAQ